MPRTGDGDDGSLEVGLMAGAGQQEPEPEPEPADEGGAALAPQLSGFDGLASFEGSINRSPTAAPAEAEEHEQQGAEPPAKARSSVASWLCGGVWRPVLFAALLGFALGIAVFGLLARGDIVHEGGTASFTCASALVMPHEANDTHTGDNLGVAVAFLARNVGASAVCSLSEMRYDLGTATVTPAQMLAIAGTPSLPTAASAAAAAPRLWARFEVLGTLFVTGVMIRDQAISPAPVPTAAQGAAAQVHSGGRLVSTGVSFLRLRTTGSGGAVHVDGGGLAEFYGCAFDGCHSSGSGGGALFFSPTSSGIVADSLLRGCVASSRQGGAMLVVTTDPAHPLAPTSPSPTPPLSTTRPSSVATTSWCRATRMWSARRPGLPAGQVRASPPTVASITSTPARPSARHSRPADKT